MPRPEDRRIADHHIRIDWPSLEERALNLVREQALQEIGGPLKLEAVVDGLIAHLDRLIAPPQPIAEMVSDAILRAVFRPILRGLAQAAWVKMQQEIEVPKKPAARRRASKAKAAK